MNNLLLRKRGLMLGGTPPNIAVSVEDNPEFVALIYNAGHCASPEYITVEEAEAFTESELPTGWQDCPHIDLRYFINCNVSLAGLKYKLTLPAKAYPLTVNRAFSVYPGLTIVVPQEVTRLDTFFINANVPLVTIIMEGNVPPTIEQSRPSWFNNSNKDYLIFVPDEAVETYRAISFWNQYNIRPMSLYTQQNQLLFTATPDNDGRIIVPISFDSDTATFECENVPELDVTNFQWNIIPKENATTGFPRRTISASNLERIDNTHAKSNDAYAVSISMVCSNFYLSGNKAFSTNDNFATAFLKGGEDYLLEVKGYHRVQNNTAAVFLSGGWSSVYLKTAEQTLSDVEIITYSTSKFSIDRTNNIVKVKEVVINGFKNSNGTLVTGEYTFNDVTNVTIGSTTNRFPLVIEACGEIEVNLYKIK